MRIIYSKKAQDHIAYWQKNNPGILFKIQNLLKSICEDPYKGLGKPEPLKHELKGLWSRRISQEHRIVYKIVGNEIRVHSLRFHY